MPDVHKFPGHIACDSDSESEIVVPIERDGEVSLSCRGHLSWKSYGGLKERADMMLGGRDHRYGLCGQGRI